MCTGQHHHWRCHTLHRRSCHRHRTRQEDRDLYDFKLKCGNRWTSWSGLWFKNEVEDKEWECPSKMYVTGMEVRPCSALAPACGCPVTAVLSGGVALQVKRGRRDFGDRDTYDFKLQCSGVWQSYMGMKFHGRAPCPIFPCRCGSCA